MLSDKLVHGVPALSLKSGLPTTTSYEGRNASFVWLRLRRAVEPGSPNSSRSAFDELGKAAIAHRASDFRLTT